MPHKKRKPWEIKASQMLQVYTALSEGAKEMYHQMPQRSQAKQGPKTVLTGFYK